MSYTKVSVNKPSKNAGSGGDKKDRIIIFDWDDVKTGPQRDSKGVRITNSIVMKDGRYMIEVYGTVTTINPSFTTEGDPDKTGFMHSVAFEHPGDEVEIMEFIQNWTNRNIGIIVQKCSSSRKRLFGSSCAPLQLGTESNDNNESNTNAMTFGAIVKSKFVPGEYEGTLSLESAIATVAADATTVDVEEGEGQYQLTDNTTSTEITTLSNAVDGGVYTLVGSGGSNPATVTDSADFILANGTTWTGISGAQLTVRAFKTGASSFVFIELSRA